MAARSAADARDSATPPPMGAGGGPPAEVPARWRVWVEAARPRTLPAAISPVVVGTAAAAHAGAELVPWRAAAALVVGLAVQVGVNYANDYFDGVRGVDTPDRVGPRRAVASGLVTPRAMRAAIGVALGVAALAGLALAVAAGWELLVVGVLCFAAALGYSGGPRPYASAALGELFVFVFFGLVATIGSAYVHTGEITGVAVAAAVPMGLLASGVLVANNLRDVPTDAAAGKRTLAVRLGDRGTRVLYRVLVLGAFLGVAVLIVLAGEPVLIGFIALPLALGPIHLVERGASGLELVRVLAATARVQLVLAVLLAAGLWLAR